MAVSLGYAQQAILERISVDDSHAVHKLASALGLGANDVRGSLGPCVIMCIGSDRSTGDALGPLVGSKLIQARYPEERVMGTLEEPVHAVNIHEALCHLRSRWRQPFTLAVDASLGQPSQVGTIVVGRGPLRPGAGVNKQLPFVGQMFITGTVNIGGFMECVVLQNTRLSLVMKMAEVISAALLMAFPYLEAPRKKPRSTESP